MKKSPYYVSLHTITTTITKYNLPNSYKRQIPIYNKRSYHHESTSSRPIREVKRDWACLVLWLVTTWEPHGDVCTFLYLFFCCWWGVCKGCGFRGISLSFFLLLFILLLISSVIVIVCVCVINSMCVLLDDMSIV